MGKDIALQNNLGPQPLWTLSQARGHDQVSAGTRIDRTIAQEADYSSSSTASKQSSTCCKITSGAFSTKSARLAAQSRDFT